MSIVNKHCINKNSSVKEALTKLAQSQLNDKESDIYLRFCAFTVKQSILKNIATNPNS